MKRKHHAANWYSIHIAQCTSKCSVTDVGKKKWCERVEARLDSDYPGWRYPRGTTMVPPTFPRTNSLDRGLNAEKFVYDLLRQSNEPMFVVHSVDFEEQCGSVRRKGEHDFVAIHHRLGPIFFQVKSTAGGVTGYDSSYQCALRQLSLDREATIRLMEKAFWHKIPPGVAVFHCPGFVVMPHCPRRDYEEKVAFKEDCRDIESFSSWWRCHLDEAAATTVFPQEMFEFLVKRFVGTMHTRGFYIMTKQQLRALQTSPGELWISGPAGSGKTWLLKQKVFDLACGGQFTVLVLCHSQPLCIHLQKHFKELTDQKLIIGKVNVLTYDQFLFTHLEISSAHVDLVRPYLIGAAIAALRQKRSQPKCMYDHIFLDEGQEFCDREIELLKFFLIKGKPYLWVMLDPYEHPQSTRSQYINYQWRLECSNRLFKVLRGTQNTFDVLKKYSTAPGVGPTPVLGHKSVGRMVTWDGSLSGDLRKNAEAVVRYVEQLRDTNKLALDDICVLTQDELTRDRLTEELQSSVACQNVKHLLKTEQMAVTVESIKRFKGLESAAVILFDPVNSKTQPESSNQLLYLALSRCSHFLVVLSSYMYAWRIKANTFSR